MKVISVAATFMETQARPKLISWEDFGITLAELRKLGDQRNLDYFLQSIITHGAIGDDGILIVDDEQKSK
ncbi:MAG: hypothetical protein ACREQA_18350 [Candidatus Binatia bacterium]